MHAYYDSGSIEYFWLLFVIYYQICTISSIQGVLYRLTIQMLPSLCNPLPHRTQLRELQSSSLPIQYLFLEHNLCLSVLMIVGLMILKFHRFHHISNNLLITWNIQLIIGGSFVMSSPRSLDGGDFEGTQSIKDQKLITMVGDS